MLLPYILPKNGIIVSLLMSIAFCFEKRRSILMEEKKLTGYSSIDKPWLKFYSSGAYEKAIRIPANKTVWDVIERRLKEHCDIPALEYFGRKFSSQEFIGLCYAWARTFRAMGIKEEEVIPIYGPFVPDVCAIALALNAIGATAYFLKLAISPEALAEETKEARFAIVFDDMWQNVHMEFEKNRFQKVIIYSVTDFMPLPINLAVSCMSILKNKNISIPKSSKYISTKTAKKFGEKYQGNIKAEFVPNRSAFITSSSGTTVGGTVKGTVATNESTIMQIVMTSNSDIQYYCGDKVLNNFPPTASTSLNVMFLLGLYKGMTVIIDPRVSEKDFYDQILKRKPNIALTTGSMWDSFFTRIEKEMKTGKRFDFSCAKGWTIGGEGTDLRRLDKWNTIMKSCNGHNMYSGYGSSELFSGIAVDNIQADSNQNNNRAVIGVGIPYAGITVGVFDESGNELSYNQRGELWVKSGSAMKCYYNKPDLTAKTLVDGWIHTGDLAEISEDGFIYIYGRCSDKIVTSTGENVYLFDIANVIKQNPRIGDAIVMNIPELNDPSKLFAHIEWLDNVSDEEKLHALQEIEEKLKNTLSEGMIIMGYAEHKRLPYSPTTLKKDKNMLAQQKSGYFKVENGKKVEIGEIR